MGEKKNDLWIGMKKLKWKNMGRIGWADKIKGKTWGLTLFAVVREMFGFLSHFFFPNPFALETR